MRLSKFIKFMLLVTVLSLIYIHMQMQIFDLAYKGKRKEKKIINLSENNNMLTYNILQLKSACHLGLNLLEENSGLQFSDNNSIVHLMTPEAMSAEEEILAAGLAHHDFEQHTLNGTRDENWAGLYAAFALGRLGDFADSSVLTKWLEDAPGGEEWAASAASYVLEQLGA